MAFGNFFGLKTQSVSEELPEIYPFPINEQDFVKIDVINIYSRILTDALERTHGIPDDKQIHLWDNCLASEHQDGLVTMLAKAMHGKKDLFLVYDKTTKLVRNANQKEQDEIKADYKERAESQKGVYITFKNYGRSDMVSLYSLLEYCTVNSLSKAMHLSKAIQLKINDLRASTAAVDSDVVKQQAVTIAQGLRDGKDVMTDAKDIIETARPDLTATNSSLEFIAKKQSFYLGMPASWITGELQSGISDTGGGDTKAVDRGLKGYYFSVIKPVVEKLFEIKTSYKSDDFSQITSALAMLKDFEIVSNELISQENKLMLINKAFGLPEDAKGDEVDDTDPDPAGTDPVPDDAPEPPQAP